MKLAEKILSMFEEVGSKETGTILWASERDENGIILDADKNEIYFDISTLKNKEDFVKLTKRGNAKPKVSFIKKRMKPDNILVAKEVEIVSGVKEEFTNMFEEKPSLPQKSTPKEYTEFLINSENKWYWPLPSGFTDSVGGYISLGSGLNFSTKSRKELEEKGYVMAPLDSKMIAKGSKDGIVLSF